MKYCFFKKICYISFAITIVFIISIFSGCKKSKFDNLISYSFLNDVHNLDPQTACESEEITIINNIYEGLFKKSLDGGYENGVAKNIEISEDEKKYTFELKQNVFWKMPNKPNEKNKVTAQDFVFAFKRLISPKTNSPYASNYFFIKNKKKINEGKEDLNNLGISAASDNKLILELEFATPFLKQLLAETPAMPCNKDFFESTNGRYGLTKANIASNGPFFLSSWETTGKTKKIKIRRNADYHFKDIVKIIGVNFSIRDKDSAFNLFQKKETNTAIVDQTQFDELSKNEITSQNFQNSVSGLVFNNNIPFFALKETRFALSSAVNREILKNKLTKSQTIAYNIVPNSVTINGVCYNKQRPDGEPLCPKYNPDIAKKLITASKNIMKNENKNFNINSYSILINSEKHFVLDQLLQTWQKDLNIFLKIQPEDKETYYKKLKNKEFDIALITLNSKYNSPASILSGFKNNSPFNYMSYDIPEFDETLNFAISPTISHTLTKYFKAEQMICHNGYFIPLFFETSYFVHDSKLKNIIFSPASKKFYYAYSEHV